MTATVTDPAVVKVHDSVDVPEPPVTVDGVRLHAELSEARATSLANPLTGTPTATVTLVGLAAILKSARPVTA